MATVLVALVLAAGTYLSIVRLPRLHDLWTTHYGHVLLIKLGLVAVALAWGGLHRVLAVPAVERGADGLFARLPRSVLGESLAGMAVLLVAAVLVDSKPPAAQPSAVRGADQWRGTGGTGRFPQRAPRAQAPPQVQAKR
jgi:putative copper export protein